MISLTTSLVLWAMYVTWTGIFLAIGFEIGRWIVAKVKGWFSFHRPDEVEQFIDEVMAAKAME